MYSITTEKRTYNSVDGEEAFKNVRKNWKDNSKITASWKFERGSKEGWKKADEETKNW